MSLPKFSRWSEAGRVFAIAFVCFLALSSLWALASPLMSAPDEPSHAIKAAAVVRGEWLGQNSDVQGQALRVRVPEYIAALNSVPSCFAFKADRSAACAPNVSKLGNNLVPSTTTAGNYNPLYYAIVGLPTLVTSGQKAIYGMRLVTAVWCALFFAVPVAFAHKLWPRRLPVVVTALAITPMCFFLAGSINPNAVEIATTLAAFVAAFAMLDASFKRPVLAASVFGVSGLILANLRPLSIAWLAIAFVGAVLLQWRRGLLTKPPRGIWIGLPLAGTGVALGLAWQIISNSFQSLGGTAVKDTPEQVVSVMLERAFDYARQYVGVMGWLDAPLPTVAYVVWDALAMGLLIGCLALWRGRRRVGIVLLSAVIIGSSRFRGNGPAG
ncbi:DUF2142 domain-containing protein [Sinomonas terrae]|uniref:DUF2142 domain-containing protein n=1 Tax=Sinomonas terrae TaxID=2908838 RepID=UPI003557ED5A